MKGKIYIVNDIAYAEMHQIPLHRFAVTLDSNIDMQLVKQWRDALSADHVLQNGTHFIFCEKITDVDFEICE
jgi:hypothetical protein